MKLTLINGYPQPFPLDEPGVDDGRYTYAAPDVNLMIEGVKSLSWVYSLTVVFESPEAAAKAREATGWEQLDEMSLIPPLSPEDGYEHPAIITKQPYGEHPQTAFCGFELE